MIGKPFGPKPLLPPDSTSAKARTIAEEIPFPSDFAALSKSAGVSLATVPG
jgi:hypothetical protein